VWIKQLEGDLAFERRLLGEIDLAHAAFAEAVQDAEFAQLLAGPVDFVGGQRGRAGACRLRGLRRFLHNGRPSVVGHGFNLPFARMARWKRTPRTPSSYFRRNASGS